MTEENEKNTLKNSEEKKTINQTKEGRKTTNRRPYHKRNIRRDDNENGQTVKNEKEQMQEMHVETAKRTRRNTNKNNS